MQRDVEVREVTRSVILRTSEARTKDLKMRTSVRSRSFATLRMTVFLLLVGCSSAAPGVKKAPLNEPVIRITQLSNVSAAARHVTGGISVQYRVDVENTAPEAVRLKRIDVQSIGFGAYTLPPLSFPFDVNISPRETRAVDFWGPAVVETTTIVGANGPVTLRVVVYYQTPAGMRQSIVVQQVHANATGD